MHIHYRYSILLFLSVIHMNVSGMDPDNTLALSDEMYSKIIACSNNKERNSLSKTCTHLNRLCRKNNCLIYNHTPLILNTIQANHALYCSIYYGKAFAVQNLLNRGVRGVDCNQKWQIDAEPSKPGVLCNIRFDKLYLCWQPLDLACSHNNNVIINLLKEYGACTSEDTQGKIFPRFLQAVCFDDLLQLQDWIGKQKQEDESDEFDAYLPSSLMIVVRKGYTDILAELLKNKEAIKKVQSTKGCEEFFGHILFTAISFGHAGIVEQLLPYYPKDIYQGYPSIATAVYFNYYDIAKLLVEDSYCCRDVNICFTGNNAHPLHYAVYYKNVAMVKLLLAVPEININVINKEKNTPLDMVPVMRTAQDDEIMKLLKGKGAETNRWPKVPWHNPVSWYFL